MLLAMPQKPSKMLLECFDSAWYLSQYPDVAQSRSLPKKHYLNFGWREGRWPCHFESVSLDTKLWASPTPHKELSLMESLFQSTTGFEKGLAGWFLCRWYVSLGDWHKGLDYIDETFEILNATNFFGHDGVRSLYFLCLYHTGRRLDAEHICENIRWFESSNKNLARTMLTKGSAFYLNETFSENKLLNLQSDTEHLDNINTVSHPRRRLSFFAPLVSVIVPCFNSAKTIRTALNSLLNQTYHKIEIIVVDDASTDETEQVVKSYTDQRVVYHKLPENRGAYNARNLGLKKAKGQYITTHDADDWSHPQKLEVQVNALKSTKGAKASISHWVRCTPNLDFYRWKIEDGLVQRNVSSLMFTRQVRRDLGYWDAVAVNADTEFYYRIIAKYKHSAIVEVLPNVPLAFGRICPNSLTNQGPTHIKTQFGGLRKAYLDNAFTWHQTSKSLHMPLKSKRKFVVPPFMCRGEVRFKNDNLKRYVKETLAFDSTWYLAKYRDIKESGVEPLDHYVTHGIHEGREPNPIFSPTAFAWTNNVSLYEAFTLWLLEEQKGNKLLSLYGAKEKGTKKNVMMFAHLAGPDLFGAEKSFLDCVQMLAENDVNIYVVLPSALNEEYVNEVLKYATKVFFLPICWWDGKREVINTQVAIIEKLITSQNIDIVYVNTITVWEPLVASRNLGVQSIMHIRELPENDKSLCEALRASPEMIRKHVAKAADLYIANSKFTQSYYDLGKVCEVVPNAVSINNALNNANKESSPFVVAMMSSNIEKKGIRDFFDIAFECSKRKLPVLFEVHGPCTDILTSLLNNYSEENVVFKGYSKDTANTLRTVNVILNLSNFDESFGRTVIEGMACGCVPIAYNKGALTEVVSEGCGFLVPFKMTSEVVDLIDKLSQNREEFEKLSKQASKAVENSYSKQKVKVKFSEAILAR